MSIQWVNRPCKKKGVFCALATVRISQDLIICDVMYRICMCESIWSDNQATKASGDQAPPVRSQDCGSAGRRAKRTKSKQSQSGLVKIHQELNVHRSTSHVHHIRRGKRCWLVHFTCTPAPVQPIHAIRRWWWRWCWVPSDGHKSIVLTGLHADSLFAS